MGENFDSKSFSKVSPIWSRVCPNRSTPTSQLSNTFFRPFLQDVWRTRVEAGMQVQAHHG